MRRVLDVGLQADTFTNNASALPCRVLSRRLPIVMPAAIKAHFHSQADCRRDPLGPGCFTPGIVVRAPGNDSKLKSLGSRATVEQLRTKEFSRRSSEIPNPSRRGITLPQLRFLVGFVDKALPSPSSFHHSWANCFSGQGFFPPPFHTSGRQSGLPPLLG